MLNTVQILDELKMAFAPSQAESLAMLANKLYMEIANTLIKEGFQELREIVRVLSERIDRLAEAQSKTEQAVDSFKRTSEENFNRVWKVIVELTEAQKRTEERINELAEAQKRTEERVNELTEAQKRTEERVNELTEAQKRTEERINELAEAQKRTEERVNELTEAQKRTEERVNELTEAQKRTEERVNELAEAQKRTEERVNELAEAQKRTEERINELAEAQAKTEQSLESFKKTTEENFSRVWKAIDELTEAQKKTEEELKRLVGEHKKTREHLGTLSHTVGYVLEDRAYKGLVGLLKRDFGLEVIEGLRRDYIEVGIDKYEEVNIIGRARVNGKEVWVIGECKSQLKKGDVDEFLRSVKRIEPYVSGEKVIVAVTYQAPPPVRKYVEQKGIKLYFSYELPL